MSGIYSLSLAPTMSGRFFGGSQPFTYFAQSLMRDWRNPRYGLDVFRSMARVPTARDFADMMAMRGGSPLLAQRLYDQALRQSGMQAFSAWRQYRLGMDQMLAQLATAGMQRDLELMGLRYQDRWLRRQSRLSFLNNLLGIAGTLGAVAIGNRSGGGDSGFLNSLLGVAGSLGTFVGGPLAGVAAVGLGVASRLFR